MDHDAALPRLSTIEPTVAIGYLYSFGPTRFHLIDGPSAADQEFRQKRETPHARS
jgi:hypothetical protein